MLEDALFTRNTFDGLSVAVLVLGEMGVVSVTDNAVRACYGGFWLVPADGDTTVALLDLLDPTDPNASDYAATYGITALIDPVLWLATALGRLLPLTPPPLGAAIVLRPIGMPSALLPRASQLLQLLAPAATTTTTTPTGSTTQAPVADDLITSERLTVAAPEATKAATRPTWRRTSRRPARARWTSGPRSRQSTTSA